MRKVLVFSLGAIGGAERMTINIARILSQGNYMVKFIILGGDKRILDFVPKEFDVGYAPYNLKSLFSLLRMYLIIRKENPDIVFGTQTRINHFAIIASKLSCKKVVVRSSGMMNYYSSKFRFAMKVIYPHADCIITQQEEMRKEMAVNCKIPLNKIVTLQNILDYKTIDIKKNAESPFEQNNTKNFVNVGRICYNKSHDMTIKAFAIVKKQLPNSQLYFIGPCEKEEISFFEEIKLLVANLKLEDSVHFIGYDSNPYRWVKNCDCFVFPSRHEGLPNALLEASYLGVPCVAAKCLDIIPEIIKDGINGYVVEVEDVSMLAARMIDALKLKDCRMIYKSSSEEDYLSVFDKISRE